MVVPTREYENGKAIIVDAAFRKFASLAEAFDQHAQLLATSPHYARARMFENDPAEFADALTNVYATDPNYGKLLNSIMQGANLKQYDLPSHAPGVAALEVAAAALDIDADRISDDKLVDRLVDIGSDTDQLDAIQTVAARKLLDYDKEVYPSDGCAITLSLLLQQAGISVPDTYQALELTDVLVDRGWQRIAIGDQQRGDVGSTCGKKPNHGSDHIYLVLKTLNKDEMVVADNQEREPHFRFASGKGRTPTKCFLRAPS